MSNQIIEGVLSSYFQENLGMSVSSWASYQQDIGEKTLIYRKYTDGDHDANQSTEMKNLLRSTGELSTELNDNHCPIIIETMNDRVKVDEITADNEGGTKWVQELLETVGFDSLQTGLHEATIRDANSYIMVSWDEDTKQITWTHEPAYDGSKGMMMLYAEHKPVAALKIWHLVQTNTGTESEDSETVTFANLYFEDRIEKYKGTNGAVMPREDLATGHSLGDHVFPWTDTMKEGGQPLGLPVIHFANKVRKYDDYGISEIHGAIPDQNAINRNRYSMIMNAELAAFMIRYAIGFNPPDGLTPAMWIKISKDAPLTPDQKIDLGVLEAGEIVPYIEMGRYMTERIYDKTNTPRHDNVSANTSGEALKQREIGLVSKVKRFHTPVGEKWKDAVNLSARVFSAFSGQSAPVFERLTLKWQDPNVRNDAEILKLAIEEFKNVHHDLELYLETVAPIRGWDEKKIKEILDRQEEKERQMIQEEFSRAVPPFTSAPPQNGNQAPVPQAVGA